MNEPAQPNPSAADPALSSPTEAELRAALVRRTSELEALAAGAKLAFRTAGYGLPVVLIYGVVGGYVSHAVVHLAFGARDADPQMVQLWYQIAFGLGGFASLYAILQFAKRNEVSRTSWWPALFAAPLLLLGMGLSLGQSEQMRQLGPLMLSMFLMAWSLVWYSFAGAAASIVWLRTGHAALEGRSIGAAEVLDEVRTRTIEVAGPHGARIHAETIGMQLLLPGIFYALQLAFTDMVAVLDPDRPALRRSGQLTFGIRGRLFRMMFLWFLAAVVLWFGVAMPLEGVDSVELALEKGMELLLDPLAPSRATYIAQAVAMSLLGWVLQLALLVVYLEREGQVRAKTALKKLKAAAPAQPGTAQG